MVSRPRRRKTLPDTRGAGTGGARRAIRPAAVGARAPVSPLDRVRAICLGLPETSERLSHGAPTFFVGKRTFLTYLENHHGDGRLAIWCAAPSGMQELLVRNAPERYYVPPYVGHRGWLGVRLDRDVSRGELAGVVEDAYLTVAPKKLIEKSGL